jgi:hypothetical protein
MVRMTAIGGRFDVQVLQLFRDRRKRRKASLTIESAFSLPSSVEQLFAAVGDGVDGSPRRKWAAMYTAMAEITERDVTVEMRRHA